VPISPILRKNLPLLVAGVITISAVIIFRISMKWDGISLTVRLQDIAGLLAPLAFASAVVERAVEILISPWRDAAASKLETELAAVKADPKALPVDVKKASDALDDYRGETQRYAFAISLTLSVFVAMAGVRALGPFADAAKLRDPKITSDGQHLFFLCVDVVLSSALLAGGADGIHSIVNAVTNFFDSTANKTK
jgi:hypothetical protein